MLLLFPHARTQAGIKPVAAESCKCPTCAAGACTRLAGTILTPLLTSALALCGAQHSITAHSCWGAIMVHAHFEEC